MDAKSAELKYALPAASKEVADEEMHNKVCYMTLPEEPKVDNEPPSSPLIRAKAFLICPLTRLFYRVFVKCVPRMSSLLRSLQILS